MYNFKDFSSVTLTRLPVSVTWTKINTFKKHISQKLNPSISCVNLLIFFGLKDPTAKQSFPWELSQGQDLLQEERQSGGFALCF